MRKVVSLFVLGAIVAATTSCGDAVRQGAAPAYVVVDQLQGSPGSDPGALGNPLLSDVQTIVVTGGTCSLTNPCPTYFNDVGQVVLRLVPKDIGTPGAPSTLTTNNEVTITRYHVQYIRADGHNVQGVDVPYAFDSAVTGTVPATGNVTLSFDLVRNIAKKEAPLVQLISNGALLTTIAEVTFYGQDRTGNAVSVVGQIQVEFGNFADK
jgi:hypothetical protein